MEKTFDTSTLNGLKAAERYKASLENKYESVRTVPVGLNRVRITGVEATQQEERDALQSNFEPANDEFPARCVVCFNPVNKPNADGVCKPCLEQKPFDVEASNAIPQQFPPRKSCSMIRALRFGRKTRFAQR